MSSLVFALILVILVATYALFRAFGGFGKPTLEFLPSRSVQSVAQLPVVVHLTPTVTSPLATSHIDQEITLSLVVVDSSVILATRARRVTACLPLRQKRSMRPNPRLACVKVLKRVLLLVFPLHVPLFVMNRIPPDVQ